MKSKILWILVSGFLAVPWLNLIAQPAIQGMVMEETDDGRFSPLPFANLIWLGTTIGSVTDSSGFFSIPDRTPGKLIVSYVGFLPDTIFLSRPPGDRLMVILKNSRMTDAVQVFGRTQSTRIDYLSVLPSQVMSKTELLKAACCNLSESFETNPTIDVSFSDAITGTRQIRLLGLASPYSPILFENMPGLSGIGSVFGLSLVPGPWINAINVSKGMGSVVNGYESISGQIDVEFDRPEIGKPWFINGFASQDGRIEANVNHTRNLTDQIGTTLLLHASARPVEEDMNEDGFLDSPTGNQLNLINRYTTHFTEDWLFQAGAQVLRDEKIAGQPDWSANDTSRWGASILTNRAVVWSKLGYVFPQAKYRSVGLQVSVTGHEQESQFGTRVYDASQQTVYSNLIYQDIIGTSDHKYRTGLNIVSDRWSETIDTLKPDHRYLTTGTFLEYTYTDLEVLTIILGLRYDYHSRFGGFATPRFHARYAFSDQTILRASAGLGRRYPIILAENQQLFTSNRKITLPLSNRQYDFNMEKAMNTGVNLTHHFTLSYRDAYFSADYYYSVISNPLLIDLDVDPQQAVIYQAGKSGSTHSFQLEVGAEPLKFLDIRLAYRFSSTDQPFRSGTNETPLVASHRGFLNWDYEWLSDDDNSSWKLDHTIQWIGSKRIPSTRSNPVQYRMDSRSPSFFLMNAQITRIFNEQWDVYLGVENLTDFRQENPILSADQPTSPWFDASLVWGPVTGRMIYAGFRFTGL